MGKVFEKELDKAIDERFKNDPDFVRWFLERTKFEGEVARYFWSRSDNPWGRFSVPVQSSETGEIENVMMESETDVLVVFEGDSAGKFALHIENKISGGKFTPLQPEQYGIRAESWKNDSRYCDYSDYQTVLIAPKAFYKANKESSDKFDIYISHEEIAEHIPLFEQAYDRKS